MDSLLGEDVAQRLQDSTVKRLVVGLSGGVDSVSMLHAVVSANPGKPVVALHVDHGIQVASKKFVSVCRSVCERLSVDLTVSAVEVDVSGSLETNARHARYAAFEEFINPGDLLLLSHHAGDQVETLLFRLFRGSRVAGLEGMPRERPIGEGHLYRPLLEVSKEVILAYAVEQNLTWIEDPTNTDTTADRNYIRHQVLPAIEQRWPDVRRSLLRALETDSRARQVLHDKYLELLDEVRQSRECLNLTLLRHRQVGELVDLFTAWLMDMGLPLPTGRLLEETARSILASQTVEVTTRDFEFRQYDGGLYLLKPMPPLSLPRFPLQAGTQDLPGGRISNVLTKGGGLKPSSAYEVGFRVGGERLRIRHDRSFKNLCQENGIPAWLRDRVPLIFHDTELVAIAALPGWGTPMLVADGWSTPDSAPGQEIQLHLNDRWPG